MSDLGDGVFSLDDETVAFPEAVGLIHADDGWHVTLKAFMKDNPEETVMVILGRPLDNEAAAMIAGAVIAKIAFEDTPRPNPRMN